MRKPFVFVGVLLLAALLPGTLGGRAGAKADLQSGGGAVCCPGEFEKLQAIWMLWPPDLYNEGSRPVYPVMIEMIKALDPYVKVNLIVQSKEEEAEIKSLLKEIRIFRG
jgi:agmatine/peptidylarginine deiminase